MALEGKNAEPHISNVSSRKKVIQETTKKVAKVKNLPIGGRLRLFKKKWKNITADNFILSCLDGYSIQFNIVPYQYSGHEQRILSKNEKRLIEMEVYKLIGKKLAIEKCDPSKNQFISTYFLVKKPDGSHRY